MEPDERQVPREGLKHRIGAIQPLRISDKVKLSDRMPMVVVKLKERELWALLDPGATRSFIDPEVAEFVSEFAQELETPLDFVCAGGTTMTFASKVINERCWRLTAGAANIHSTSGRLGYDIILGYDFLSAYKKTEMETPGETLFRRGIQLDERFRILLDPYIDVLREILPGGITDRPQKHHIGTIPGLVPNYRRQVYPMSEERLRKLKELLRTLLERGFIVPSSSPIAAPVFFVEKKGTEDLRLVIDYRELITIKDDYPIPRVHDLIARLGKAQWFSTLDLTSGYYQVQVAEPDQSRATFEGCASGRDTTQIYDPDEELTIKADASKYAIGAVLEQEGHPIAFESKKLGPREQFTPAYESEPLAVIYALMKWKQLIGTKKVRTETDHATLGRILRQKNVTPRLGYWLDRLADFDIEVVYKPGKQNVVADALSREVFHLRPGGLLQPLPIPNMPWKEIAIDLIVGLPRTKEGWDAILTSVCRLTKINHFVPTKHSASAEDIAILLVREVIRLHGVPSAIVSDRDTKFTSEDWRFMCKRLAIEQKMSTAHHPQTDEQAERTNQTIEQMLRCSISGDDTRWADLLPLLEFAYNSTVHASTKATPFELLYGFTPSKPLCKKFAIPNQSVELLFPWKAHVQVQRAKRELKKAQEYQKRYADTKQRDVSFQVGQEVWLNTINLDMEGESKALKPKFIGPFKIIKMYGPSAARLELLKSMLIHPVFHNSLLAPVVQEPPNLKRSPPEQDPVAEQEYTIEGILDQKEENQTRFFLIKWTDGSTTWEPESNLSGAKKTLQRYLRKRLRANASRGGGRI
ncbi:retrotransposon nucleocapsid related [Cystoisospora suis]|uniref:Retrotransposon nucleocapsid related n=1 Tax=Cystoisospora suis TaxID=483139 RepID=A0A2C6KUK6_9APIC|nr:retrotransposon nucleocapsid related [Cystoisospora suis]